MTTLNELTSRRCLPCTSDTPTLSRTETTRYLSAMQEWQLSENNSRITRRFNFKNFHHTMAFINAMAWLAHQEDHHPDFSAGYQHCLVSFTTHAIGGLSENDFICAAKVDTLMNPDRNQISGNAVS